MFCNNRLSHTTHHSCIKNFSHRINIFILSKRIWNIFIRILCITVFRNKMSITFFYNMLFHLFTEFFQYSLIFRICSQIIHLPLVVFQIIQIFCLARFHNSSLSFIHQPGCKVLTHYLLNIPVVIIAHPSYPRLMACKYSGVHVFAVCYRTGQLIVRIKTIASAINVLFILYIVLSHKRLTFNIIRYVNTG